ncbi:MULTISPECIES: hypothetical protein [unclassified Bradyrhizobium]
MDFDDAVLHRRATIEASLIDPLLDGDMGDGFLLQVAFLGVGAVVVLECAFYIDRVSVVPLDQVAIVAIHRTYEPSQGDQNTPGQAVPESGRLCRQFDREVGELGSASRAFGDKHRFHQAGAFTSVWDR